MERTRAWRREQTLNKQRKRLKQLYNWDIDEKIVGKLKKNHFGCGCMLCKPWKHNIDHQLKPSDRRRSLSSETREEGEDKIN